MILVTGATGSIGRHLVRHLQARGVPFRAMVRDEARGRELGCDIVVADFDDQSSVAAAMAGVDRLFLNGSGAVPSTGPQPMVSQQIAAIDSAVKAGVTAIVKVSVLGARPGGRLAQGAHWQIEQYLKAAPVAWSLLQPSGYMQNFLTGAAGTLDAGDVIGLPGDWRVSYIDCYDIAACAAELLTQSDPPCATYRLTGPEALTHAQVAARLTAAVGRPIPSVELTGEEMASRLTAQGLPAGFAADVVALWREVVAGSLATTTPTVRELTGREPRSFDEFLAATVPPASAYRDAPL